MAPESDGAKSGTKVTTVDETLRGLMSDVRTLDETARESDHDYDTTQVFIMPVGDWTRRVSAVLRDQQTRRHRTCWVRGPFTSPFSVAHEFSQLVLFASGIGIVRHSTARTRDWSSMQASPFLLARSCPAWLPNFCALRASSRAGCGAVDLWSGQTPSLGVLGQYRGKRRVTFLVWMTRSATMLKFFAPLLADAQVATIYYTGTSTPQAHDPELSRLPSDLPCLLRVLSVLRVCSLRVLLH